jgi:hypothetical protein
MCCRNKVTLKNNSDKALGMKLLKKVTAMKRLTMIPFKQVTPMKR